MAPSYGHSEFQHNNISIRSTQHHIPSVDMVFLQMDGFDFGEQQQQSVKEKPQAEALLLNAPGGRSGANVIVGVGADQNKDKGVVDFDSAV